MAPILQKVEGRKRDRLLPCMSLTATGDESDVKRNEDDQSDTTDQVQTPDQAVQDIPDLFDENVQSQVKYSQIIDTQDSQIMDTQDDDSQTVDASQSSTCSTRIQML